MVQSKCGDAAVQRCSDAEVQRFSSQQRFSRDAEVQVILMVQSTRVSAEEVLQWFCRGADEVVLRCLLGAY